MSNQLPTDPMPEFPDTHERQGDPAFVVIQGYDFRSFGFLTTNYPNNALVGFGEDQRETFDCLDDFRVALDWDLNAAKDTADSPEEVDEERRLQAALLAQIPADWPKTRADADPTDW
jgi:hypothetical protein